MTDFLINTPAHKRYYLPDGMHVVDSLIFGGSMRCSVEHSLTGEYRERLTIDITKDNWKFLWETFQALAEKKYRKQPNLRAKRGPR